MSFAARDLSFAARDLTLTAIDVFPIAFEFCSLRFEFHSPRFDFDSPSSIQARSQEFRRGQAHFFQARHTYIINNFEYRYIMITF